MMLETWQAGNLADLPRSSSGADPSPARRISRRFQMVKGAARLGWDPLWGKAGTDTLGFVEA